MTPDSSSQSAARETVLDALEQLEREATAGPWDQIPHLYSGEEVGAGKPVTDERLILLSRNHLRALIAVARAAVSYRNSRNEYVINYSGEIPAYTQSQKAGIALDGALALLTPEPEE